MTVDVTALVTENLDIWSSTIKKKNTTGRGSSKKTELYGIKKLRELILELAVRGLLVPQDPNDEPASVLLEKISTEKSRLLKEKKIKKQKPLPPIEEGKKPFELPAGWSWTQLGEISEIAPRNTLNDELEVSFVPMPMITTSYKGDHEQEVKAWSEIKKGYTHFANGDIGLAKITPCFENSKAAVFKNLKNGYGAGTTELHIARPIPCTLEPLFILLYLKAPMFLKKGKSKMTGSAGQKRVPNSFFSGNLLPLPPQKEQHRIVSKVNELMTLCDQLEQQQESSIAAHETLVKTVLEAVTRPTAISGGSEGNATAILFEHFDTLFTTEHSINQLKQTILQLAVMGKLVPQNPNDEPASELLKKIAAEKVLLVKEKKIKKQKPLPPIGEDEKPFELTLGWEWCRFDNLSTLITSGSRGWKEFYSDTGATFIRSQDIKYDRLEFDNRAFVSLPNSTEGTRTRVDQFDLLMTITGANVAKVALLDHEIEEAYVSQHVALIRLVDVLLGKFLHVWLKGEYGGRSLLLGNSYGAKPGLNLMNIRELQLPIPPFNEQKRIVTKVNELMTLCDSMLDRIKAAQTTQLNLTDAIAEQATS